MNCEKVVNTKGSDKMHVTTELSELEFSFIHMCQQKKKKQKYEIAILTFLYVVIAI